MTWRCSHFTDLTSFELYLLAKLRVDVFVVEQACAYPELDGLDLLDDTVHVFATRETLPIAYARILAPRTDTPDPLPLRIGRVVVDPRHRRQGLASALMQRVLMQCETLFCGQDQTLAAQLEVKDFYASLGFNTISEPYLEDGIMHIDMQRQTTVLQTRN